MLLALGEEAEAARFVRELRASNADADALLVPVAATLLERDHHRLAVELATEAIELDGRCSRAHQVRVDALAEMGDLDGAREAAEEWVTIEPECPDAFVALSWARLADYDDEGAADAAARARDLDPDAPSGWLAMAYVSRLRQEWDHLMAYSLQALDRDPDNIDARLFLGEALLATGQVEEGVEVLRGIDDPRAHAALRQHRWQRGSVHTFLALVVAIVVAGVVQPSTGVLLGGVIAALVVGRRLSGADWNRTLSHPVALWGGVGIAAAMVLRTLL